MSEQSLIRRYAPYKSSHSDQDKALQHFSLSLKSELPIPEVTRLRTMSRGKPKLNESEQSIADFIAYVIVCVIETEYEAEKWKISKIQKL